MAELEGRWWASRQTRTADCPACVFRRKWIMAARKKTTARAATPHPEPNPTEEAAPEPEPAKKVSLVDQLIAIITGPKGDHITKISWCEEAIRNAGATPE